MTAPMLRDLGRNMGQCPDGPNISCPARVQDMHEAGTLLGEVGAFNSH